jgi:hypothetical protein
VIDRVVLEHAADPEDLEAVGVAMGRYGFKVVPMRAPQLRSGGIALWVVQVSLAAPMAAFMASFANEAGKDAYGQMKKWLGGVVEAREVRRPGGPGAIELLDSDGTSLSVPSRLPEDAIERLFEIDWSAAAGSSITWDADLRTWRPSAS